MSGPLSPTLIDNARATLAGHIHVTPVVRNALLSDRIGARVFFKLENMQRGGSFKARGAMNFIHSLVSTGFAGGLVAASAGNHALAVALAAREFGLATRIFMPVAAAPDTVESVKQLGSEVVLHGTTVDESVAEALAASRDEGSQFVHPFEHPLIMAGAGTVGIEIHEQCPEARTVVLPVGGGGLAAGVATALKANNPNTQVVGVQVDGITESRPSAAMNEILDKVLDNVVAVSEEAIVEAMHILLLQGKTLAEDAGALSLAALLEGQVSIQGRSVLAVVSGGNVDCKRLIELMEA